MIIVKKSSVFFAFLICITGSWLFYMKYSVISIENKISLAKREIGNEKKNRHILKAEWKALTSPERIQRLAVKHLGMCQMTPRQLQEFDASLFHSEESRFKRTKSLSKLVDEILLQERSD
jgi:cell division protein FtsL